MVIWGKDHYQFNRFVTSYAFGESPGSLTVVILTKLSALFTIKGTVILYKKDAPYGLNAEANKKAVVNEHRPI